MTATITPLRGYRLNDSPARWQRALRRALAEGVAVRQLATSGVWVATSGTDPDAAYVVTPTGCECRAAAEGDVCCKHRALLRHRLGTLDLDPEPEPVPPAPAVAPERAEAEQDAYDRGYAGGLAVHRGLRRVALAESGGWERLADPLARAYHRGTRDGVLAAQRAADRPLAA